MISNSVIHLWTPLQFIFQEQSYSSLQYGRSLAWDYFRGDIDDPCGIITDFCGIITDPCSIIVNTHGVVAIPEAIGSCEVTDVAMLIIV